MEVRVTNFIYAGWPIQHSGWYPEGPCLRILFSLLCTKYIFSLFYRSVGNEGNIEFTKKKVLRQPWNALMLQGSLSLRDK